MNILVVNDDGINSRGIYELVQALSEVADVYVCAPDGQRSAKSHSITLGDKVTVQQVEFPGAKEAYQTSGTPADCTKIGLQFFEAAGIHIDMVYSGINLGSNLGRDTLYSGTVGAAAEAALGGCPAVAVSIDSHTATHFDTACKIAVDIMERVYNEIEPGIVININTPDSPAEEIKGVKVAGLGPRYYDDKFRLTEDGTYELTGNPLLHDGHDKCDSMYTNEGYAVITPLQFDFTSYENIEKLEKWSL